MSTITSASSAGNISFKTSLSVKPDFLQAALWYIEHHFPVFPCHGIVDGKCTCGKRDCGSAGKHPATERGFKDASLDEKVVRAWWQKNPNYNIGVPTGAASGLTVIDVDPRHGGDISWEELTAKNGQVPETAEQITGGGGRHYVFKYVPGSPSRGGMVPGVDVRSDGGLIVAAPSVHQSGNQYLWDGIAAANALFKLADAPPWLMTLLTTKSEEHGAVLVNGKIPHGKQHSYLVSVAGTMRRKGATVGVIYAAVRAMNVEQCEKPGTDAEMRKIAEGAGKWVQGEIPVSEKKPERDIPGPRLVSATDLYAGDVVEARVLIEDFLWDGLTMLVAKPKAGKSWLTLQIAVAVAGGRRVQGIDCTETGRVLYVALEEPESRTTKRLRKIAAPGGWTANLQFVYDLLPLMGGGFEQLSMLCEKLRPRLIIIDTLTALIKSSSKRESDVFRSQYAEVSQVRKLAEQSKTAIILVHHSRKGVSEDAIEAVAGTGGVAAAVDTVWQLKRRPEGEAVLSTVGRESEDKTLAMRFDQEPFGWSIHGEDASQMVNADRRQVLELLAEDGGLTPQQLAAETGKSRPAVRMLLKRMRDDNQVQKQGLKYFPTLSVSYRVTEREKREE